MKCLYPIAELPLWRFVMPVIESNMYLLLDGDEALVIDPHANPEAEELLRENGVKHCLILLTHEHYDHISGVNWLRERCSCEVVCTEACAERIIDPSTNAAKYFQALLMDKSREELKLFTPLWDRGYGCRADVSYDESLSLKWRGLPLSLQRAPGHSPGGQLITVCDKHVFTGDNLIPGQDVITRLPGGSKKDYQEKTLPLIKALPPDCLLYPGHGQEVRNGFSI